MAPLPTTAHVEHAPTPTPIPTTPPVEQKTSRIRKTAKLVAHHAAKHTGVGIVCAVAYFDPGNWGVDLQAGSEFGYKLLFVVLLAGLFAAFLQVLASRLGCVTGLDLASHCRLLLHDRPKHTLLYRWLMLYPLYVLAEIAIISTDLAELLGSAIALCLLFPKLPLWAGVLITASDVILLLAFRDPLGGKPVKMFEVLIAGLVLTVLICMAIIISKVSVDWGQAFDGFVPSKSLFKHGALYTSIGIIGATVMPHSLFLGSALATQDRLSIKMTEKQTDTLTTGVTSSTYTSDSQVTLSSATKTTTVEKRAIVNRVKRSFRAAFRIIPLREFAHDPKTHKDRENNSYKFVRAHIYHGTFDIVFSLLGFAVLINALILILASAVFYYGSGAGSGGPAGLFDAYDLLKEVVGQAAATLFALALLASGQSSSLIATMAGQTVSEGFLRWRVSPVCRRLITRCLGLIPSMVVAIAVGREGVDTLLVASQVALSIVLPFIVFPLLWVTSSKDVMSVKRPIPPNVPLVPSPQPITESPSEPPVTETQSPSAPSAVAGLVADVEAAPRETIVDYSNGKIAMAIGWTIWLIVLLANGYAIVALALGQGD
ncbi:Nramp-domain-containing protein [Cristinia sonorae]|uniref:Nramp-domain-containing protein n=1 Tax=Cristinia sonorae TaxID=1940300 RepID=A0A8K0UKR1_9AGAR|nr:Nramp-domain-containing protein [Cristinia sonorae]